jgi:hypothetical protein
MIKPKPRITLLLAAALLTVTSSGCDERVAQVAREAADRQAQQNQSMAELQGHVAAGTRKLVEADAQARQEIVGGKPSRCWFHSFPLLGPYC